MADLRGAWPLAKQNRVETEKNFKFQDNSAKANQHIHQDIHDGGDVMTCSDATEKLKSTDFNLENVLPRVNEANMLPGDTYHSARTHTPLSLPTHVS